MVLHPVPAFSDNYIWVLHNGHEALVVDPGEASGVLAYLAQHRLALKTILVTHHHADHVGGVQALVDATGAHVVAPATEWHNPGLSAATQAQRVAQGDTLTLLGLPWQVLDVPGHTAGHVAYVCPAVAITEGTPHTTPSACTAPLLFCGDTLFSGGCGRLFEGTPAQMLASLDAMAALPMTPGCAAPTSTRCPTCALPRPWNPTTPPWRSGSATALPCAPNSAPRCPARWATSG